MSNRNKRYHCDIDSVLAIIMCQISAGTRRLPPNLATKMEPIVPTSDCFDSGSILYVFLLAVPISFLFFRFRIFIAQIGKTLCPLKLSALSDGTLLPGIICPCNACTVASRNPRAGDTKFFKRRLAGQELRV